MEVCTIEHGSTEYQAVCALRHRFLREPLGLELTAADTAGEESQHHFGLLAGESGPDRVIGGLIGKPVPELGARVVQLRQVVVHQAWRDRGAGTLLMEGAERLLAEKGYEQFLLFARAEAAPFYKKCGYALTGESRRLIGMEHHGMAKRARA